MRAATRRDPGAGGGPQVVGGFGVVAGGVVVVVKGDFGLS